VRETYTQYDLFINPKELDRERNMQKAMISIKKRYGKNAILKGMNLEEGATTIERNKQIGGHRSGE
jgi:DNA polymerase V